MIIAVNFPILAIGKKKPEKFRASTGLLFIILDCQKSVQPFYFVCILLENGKWCNGKNVAAAVFAFWRE